MTTGDIPVAARVAAGVAGASPALFVVAVMLASINLRAPFVAVAPVAGAIRAEFGVSAAEVGLLTSLPVLCFGLAAPLAPLVARRMGHELALLACLGGIILGSSARSVGPFWAALAGTVVIGLAITVGNIVVPVLIRRDVRYSRVGLVTGVYAAVLNIGAMIVSVGTAPLASALGWRGALAAWSVLTVVGGLAWWYFLRRQGAVERDEEAAAPVGAVWRRPVAWLLTLAFACQATSYYAITAWLPSLLADERGLTPEQAGAASSVFQICAVIGALGVPLLAARLPAWSTIGLIGLLWIAMPVGLLMAPEQYILVSILGGTAQGGGFAALLTVIARAAGNARQSTALSAFVQGGGYTVAALGPPVLGFAHDLTAGWTLPLLLVVGTTIGFAVFGITAALRAGAARTA